MLRIHTPVHMKLEGLGVTVTQYCIDLGIPVPSFYRALDAMKSDGMASKTVSKYVKLIELLMGCDTRKTYDNYVKEYGPKEKKEIDVLIKESFPGTHISPILETSNPKFYTAEDLDYLKKRNEEQRETIIELKDENAHLKALLKIYMTP